MRIAILGSRGIPNCYGGFEQFAEYLSVGLAREGIRVTVYNSSNHPYKDQDYKGVRIRHCFDPEDRLGTIGQFIYDLNCIRDCRSASFDIILQLGYTSSSVWGRLLPPEALTVTNMDGLEWKRSKYRPLVRKFLKAAENWAVKTSDYFIADSVGIQQYLKEIYNIDSEYIPYGAEIGLTFDQSALDLYGLKPNCYNLIIARAEPENNIETIVQGCLRAESPLVIVGNFHQTAYGRRIIEKYGDYPEIRIVGAVYDKHLLDSLRHHANLYFHGHSVGGTNPSLLEAMAAGAVICAHNNIFNRSVLKDEAFYFETAPEVAQVLEPGPDKDLKEKFREQNLLKIKTSYTWPLIIEKYKSYFESLLSQSPSF